MYKAVCSILLFLSVTCGMATAQGDFRPKIKSAADRFADQRRTIGAWCRLDFDGARLDSNGWAKFSSLTTIKTVPDFPSFLVVSRYDILMPETPTNSITVTYRVLGEFRPESGYQASADTDRVDFETVDRDDQTLVRDFAPQQPHVSRQAAVRWLKQQLLAAKNDTDRAILERAIKALDVPATVPAPAK